MLKGKYVVLSLAAALVCWQLAGIETVNSGVVDPCKTTATAGVGTSFVGTVNSPGGVVVVNSSLTFACPQGDGDALSANGLTITVTVKDNTNAPIPGVPASDFWVIGCNDRLTLCGGAGSLGASAATDAAGVTTITGDPATSGCDIGVRVVVQGIVVQTAACTPLCLAIAVATPDMKASGCAGENICPDGWVDNLDFQYFAFSYTTAGNPTPLYRYCHDYATPYGQISLADFSKFSVHRQYPATKGHQC